MATLTATTTTNGCTPPATPRKSSFFAASPTKFSFNVSSLVSPKRRASSFASRARSQSPTPPSSGPQKSAPASRDESLVEAAQDSHEVGEKEDMGKNISAVNSFDEKAKDTNNSELSLYLVSNGLITVKGAAKRSLSFAHVVGIIVKLRRIRQRTNGPRIESSSGSSPTTQQSLRLFLEQNVDVENSSANPQACLGADASEVQDLPTTTSVLKKRARVELHDRFVCDAGVEAAILIRATRSSLQEQVDGIFGPCALVDEK